ncbi:molecular chaperone [Enterobacteriaceae bacterium G50]|nr:molecular chaperone [Enterobacteriaceae bacterium G50]
MPAARSCFIMISRTGSFLLLMVACFTAHAGVMVGGTRFVFHENSKVLSIPIRNPDAQNYLIKSRVLLPQLWIKGSSAALANDFFIITPPLFRLDAGKENIIRIIRGPNSLPTDRESLFEFSVAAIPSVKEKPNSVSLAIRSRYKLFYRPENLSGDVKSAWSALRWRQQGSEIIASNPGPWFVTLATLEVNGTSVDAPGMIPPFGEMTYVACQSAAVCHIRWQSLDDYGQLTPFAAANLSR